jgi:LPXTG-motif cell wall-anchored protein
MESTQRTNQGGSIVVYIIVGVVLAALAVGAIYTARQRGEQARGGTRPVVTAPITAPESKPQAGSNGNSGTSPNPAPKTTDRTVPNAPSSPAATPSIPSSGLPHTGPADTAAMLLASAALTGVTVAYLRSRRLHSLTV